MIAIAMIAIVQQRNTKPYNVLAVALFAVLVVDPLVVLSAGFWLSFVAVGLIIYVIAGRLGKSGFFLSSIKINWVTSVGLAPLLLFFFQQVSADCAARQFHCCTYHQLGRRPLGFTFNAYYVLCTTNGG